MRAGLDGAPVVAGGQGHRVDAVHHALVVRAGAVGVGVREPRGLRDPMRHLRAGEAEVRQRLEGDAAGGAREPQVGEIGEDAQPHPAAGDALDQRRDALAHGVDQVGAHRVLGIDDQVHDRVRLSADRQQSHFEVLRASPSRLHRRMQAVRHGEDRVLLPEDRRLGSLGVGKLGDLHLADHARRVGVRLEPAALADDLRGERYRRDHGSLLHRHGDQDVLAVDEEVEADADGEPEHADRVLDHRVGVGERQGGAFPQAVHLVARQLELFGKAPQTLRHLHLVEARQPAGTHPGDLLGGRSLAQFQ